MKKLLLVLSIALAFVSCSEDDSKKDPADVTCRVTKSTRFTDNLKVLELGYEYEGERYKSGSYYDYQNGSYSMSYDYITNDSVVVSISNGVLNIYKNEGDRIVQYLLQGGRKSLDHIYYLDETSRLTKQEDYDGFGDLAYWHEYNYYQDSLVVETHSRYGLFTGQIQYISVSREFQSDRVVDVSGIPFGFSISRFAPKSSDLYSYSSQGELLDILHSENIFEFNEFGYPTIAFSSQRSSLGSFIEEINYEYECD